MRTVLLICAGALIGIARGAAMGLAFAWAGIMVFILTSPRPEAHEHSFGLLGWLLIGAAAGAVIGAVVGGVAGFQAARR